MAGFKITLLGAGALPADPFQKHEIIFIGNPELF